MIRMATVNDIDSLIKLRIRLLNEAKKNIENYDWEKYSQVLRSFYNEGLLNGTVAAYLKEEKEIIVAIGVICFSNTCPTLYNLDGKVAKITDMYTVPEYRNKGIGNELLKNVMEHAKKSGYKNVKLNATDSGRKLYEKYGFQDLTGEMSYKFV